MKVELPTEVDLTAKIPPWIEPFGFYSTLLTEGVWLPARTDKGIEARPFVAAATKDPDSLGVASLKLCDFLATDRIGDFKVNGVFPSETTETFLMTPQSLAFFKSEKPPIPRETDQSLDSLLTRFTQMNNPAVNIITKRAIEATYFYDVFDHFPLIFIFGVSESGKTRLLKVFLFGSYHGKLMIDPSEASVFRGREEEKHTLCIDECEQFSNPKNPAYKMILTLLNASYSKYTSVPRYDEAGAGKKVRRDFHLYGPTVLDGTKQIQGITLSRAIMLISYKVRRNFPEPKPEAFQSFREEMYYHRLTQAFRVKSVYDETDISKKATARFEEIFQPLFALTKIFGTPEEEAALTEFVKEYEKTMRIEAVNLTEEQEVIDTIQDYIGKSFTPKGEWWPIKLITVGLNKKYSRTYHPKTVSVILSKMGLDKRKHTAEGKEVWITQADMDSLKERYGFQNDDESDKNDPDDEKQGSQKRLDNNSPTAKEPSKSSQPSDSSESSHEEESTLNIQEAEA